MVPILDVTQQDDAVIATPRIARFDLDTTAAFRTELAALMAPTETRPLLLELVNVEMIPTVALGVLVECLKKCRESGRPLALTHVQPAVDRTLRLCSLDEVLPIHADTETALASLAESGRSASRTE